MQIVKTKSRYLLPLTGLAALTGILGVGCGGSSNSSSLTRQVTTYGPAVTVGNGTGRAYITLQGNVPISTGVELTEAGTTNFAPPAPGQAAFEYSFPPPPQLAATTPFLNVGIFASPGHPPANQQDVPHIHPTWFIITPEERAQIVSDSPLNSVPVAPEEIPANHMVFATQGYFPSIGELSLDPILPGYRETPMVTTAYEYRFFNGHMTLVALDFANSFFPSKQEVVSPLEIPQKYPKPGYYPTTYHLHWDKNHKVFQMSVENFVLRP